MPPHPHLHLHPPCTIIRGLESGLTCVRFAWCLFADTDVSLGGDVGGEGGGRDSRLSVCVGCSKNPSHFCIGGARAALILAQKAANRRKKRRHKAAARGATAPI